MDALCKEKLEKAYPACRSTLDSDVWDRIIAACPIEAEIETFPDTLALQMDELGLHHFLPELARLESSCHKVMTAKIEIPPEVDQPEVNPTVELLQFSWKNLSSIFNSHRHKALAAPEPGEEFVLVWKDPKTAELRVRAATDEDLL
ncbi:MAG TPA: hypothetical protein EYP19_01080, partial [Desulfobacterales bacterium]|nr:hypothetical protein [Desulfobacterales bacterium]